jgi:hypothetical protein
LGAPRVAVAGSAGRVFAVDDGADYCGSADLSGSSGSTRSARFRTALRGRRRPPDEVLFTQPAAGADTAARVPADRFRDRRGARPAEYADLSRTIRRVRSSMPGGVPTVTDVELSELRVGYGVALEPTPRARSAAREPRVVDRRRVFNLAFDPCSTRPTRGEPLMGHR